MSIINPQKIVDQGIVKDLEGGAMEVQMNGIDLTVEKVEIIKGGFLGKNQRDITEYIPIAEDGEMYSLQRSQVYSITFQQHVDIPEGMAAHIIARSTLNRMGSFITSGLYDSGFKNQIGAVLRVGAPITIQKGARIAQIIFQEAKSASLYDGIYQEKDDVQKT